MRIEILKPGDESRLEAFLSPRLDSSLFLLSNSRRGGLPAIRAYAALGFRRIGDHRIVLRR